MSISILLNRSTRNIPGGAFKIRSRDTSQWIEQLRPVLPFLKRPPQCPQVFLGHTPRMHRPESTFRGTPQTALDKPDGNTTFPPVLKSKPEETNGPTLAGPWRHQLCAPEHTSESWQGIKHPSREGVERLDTALDFCIPRSRRSNILGIWNLAQRGRCSFCPRDCS